MKQKSALGLDDRLKADQRIGLSLPPLADGLTLARNR